MVKIGKYFLAYDKRYTASRHTSNQNNKKRSIKVKLENILKEKDSELTNLRAQMSDMTQCRKEQLSEDLSETLKNEMKKNSELNSFRGHLEDEIKKRDADLNTLKENISEMEKLKEIVLGNIVEMECVICNDVYKFPVVLPCGHVLCMICLYTHMKSKYAYQERVFRMCPECRKPFELDKIVKLYCGMDEVTERLAAAAQDICNPGQYSSLDDWNKDRKRSEECYKEMRADNGRTMLQKWGDIKYGNTSAQYNPNYDDLFEREEVEDKNAKYLLVKGIVPSEYLSRARIEGGKSRYEKEEAAILRRMIEFAKPNEIAPSKNSLEKWLRHCSHELGNRPNNIPLFGFNRNETMLRKTEMKHFRQHMFDSYFSQKYGAWKTITEQRLQSMYDTKRNLRRNWIFLGLEPDIVLFADGEELYCEEMSRKVWSKKRKRCAMSSSSSSSSSHSGSNNSSSSGSMAGGAGPSGGWSAVRQNINISSNKHK